MFAAAAMAEDAGFQMPRQQFYPERIEGRTHRGNLIQDIHAIAIVIDHSLDPGHLPGDAAQARF